MYSRSSLFISALVAVSLLFVQPASAAGMTSEMRTNMINEVRAQVDASLSVEEKSAALFGMLKAKFAQVGDDDESAYLALAETLMDNADNLDLIEECMDDVESGVITI